MVIRYLCLLACLSGILAAGELAPGTLSDAIFDAVVCQPVGVCSPTTTFNVPGGIGTADSGSGWAWSANASTSQDAGGIASANVSGADEYPMASASVSYYLELLGPQPADAMFTVPVHISGNGTATATDAGEATGLIAIDGNYFSVCSFPAQPGCELGSLSIDQTVYIAPNVPIPVFLEAEADISYTQTLYTGGSASAVIDPMFTIEPGYGDYSLEFSNGISLNPAPTPEPTLFVLIAVFVGGLSGLKAFLQRKKAAPVRVRA